MENSGFQTQINSFVQRDTVFRLIHHIAIPAKSPIKPYVRYVVRIPQPRPSQPAAQAVITSPTTRHSKISRNGKNLKQNRLLFFNIKS